MASRGSVMARDKSIAAKRPPFSTRRLAEHVFRVANLREIQLSECSAKHTLQSKKPPRHVRMSVSTEAGINADDGRVVVRAGFDVHAHVDDDESQYVHVECEFLLLYELTSMEGIEEQHVEAFTKWIALNNAWPYAREFVQGITCRMGISPLRMPLHKPETLVEAEDAGD
jgi:preprotein translocase subunit SecB